MGFRIAEALRRCPLYFILDGSLCIHRDPVDVGIEALESGVAVLQLRLKDYTVDELTAIARELKSEFIDSDWILIVNDSVEAALASGADGVHLGQDDMPVAAARRAGPKLVIGATARTPAVAVAAEADGADYLGCGSVYISGTKPGLPVIGAEGLRQICGNVSIPVVGIGGIDSSNAAEVMAAGAAGFCSVGPFAGARSILETTHELRKAAGNAGEAHGG